jgi:hypothetical protein
MGRKWRFCSKDVDATILTIGLSEGDPSAFNTTSPASAYFTLVEVEGTVSSPTMRRNSFGNWEKRRNVVGSLGATATFGARRNRSRLSLRKGKFESMQSA